MPTSESSRVPPKISACVITLNEADRIEACLKSLAFCDDIVVVDSGSTDRTAELAAALGARVLQRVFDGYRSQKDFAVRAAQHDWVLCLDADERVTPALHASIEAERARDFSAAGYRFARATEYFGAFLHHGNAYPDRVLRLPLFLSPEGNSDGGYAVGSYREVDPLLGSMEELRALTHELRVAGISLCLDFVFNHTSDEHEWAERAKAGDREMREYYLTFPDRTLPDAYEEHLREIFPTIRRGSFTCNEAMQRWVWTTSRISFQWDLNYANPAVFRAMAGEMLFLANQGVEVLRLDAVAFIWKRLGTNCENQPEAHLIIQAMNAVVRIAAPGMLFEERGDCSPG